MYTSLALDASGRPYISYHDSTNDDLEYDGANWITETVDSAGDVGVSTSLAWTPLTGHTSVTTTGATKTSSTLTLTAQIG